MSNLRLGVIVRSWLTVAILGASLLSQHEDSLAAGACLPVDAMISGREVRFELISDKPVRPAGSPYTLGFNLEWKTFQRDIWKDASQSIDAVAAGTLAVWPGLVYRFPGGTVANFLDLNFSVGDRRHRPKQKAVKWDAPEGMTFGLDEYLALVREVGGVSWIVANIFGTIEGAVPIDVLLPKWEALAARLKERGGVQAIELGNELYLDRYDLTPELYAERANAAASVFRRHLPDAHLVVALSDFDVRSHRKSDYNRRFLSRLRIDDVHFAQHSYYDGPPGGPPIPNRLRSLCESIEQVKQAGHVNPVVWLTEHARWPGGKTTDPDWKKLWEKSNNLEAAISVADFVIATSQVSEIQGSFIHSLAGTLTPWAFFMRENATTLRSAVAEVQALINEVGKSNVMPTRTISTKGGGGWGADYDSRGVILRHSTTGNWQLIAVNRSGRPLDGDVLIPALRDTRTLATMRSVSDPVAGSNNTADQPARLTPIEVTEEIFFNGTGSGRVTLKPYSVTLVDFRPSQPEGMKTFQ